MAITRTAKGTASSRLSGNDLTINGITVTGGSALIAGVAWREAVPGDVPVLLLQGRRFTEIPGTRHQDGDRITTMMSVRARVDQTNVSLVATWPNNLNHRALFLTELAGGATLHVGQTVNSVSGLVHTSGGILTPTIAETMTIAAFHVYGPGSDNNPAPFATLGHTLGQEASTQGGPATDNITLYETFESLTVIGDVQSSITIPTARDAHAVIAAFSLYDTFSVSSVKHVPWNVYQGSNRVFFTIDDSAGNPIVEVGLPTDVFTSLTDQQVTDYLFSVAQWYVDRETGVNPLEEPYPEIESRLATFVNTQLAV